MFHSFSRAEAFATTFLGQLFNSMMWDHLFNSDESSHRECLILPRHLSFHPTSMVSSPSFRSRDGSNSLTPKNAVDSMVVTYSDSNKEKVSIVVVKADGEDDVWRPCQVSLNFPESDAKICKVAGFRGLVTGEILIPEK